MEPRFRHAKLREVAVNGEPFKTILVKRKAHTNLDSSSRGFVFDTVDAPASELDLPINMRPASAPVVASTALPERELETIFYEARAHDGCYQVRLFPSVNLSSNNPYRPPPRPWA